MMNREIKFRYFDKSNGNMLYEGQNNIKGSSFYCSKTTFFMAKYGEGEIMQFTGLKDKNGVDIYEGDIIEWEYDNTPMPCIGVVEYNSSMACFSIPMDNNGQFPLSMEIIGNIHQSPELLTGKI